MLDKLRENAVTCFALSLIAAYSVSEGYYSHFNLNIQTYISIEDLTLVFAEWVWLFVAIAFAYYLIFGKLVEYLQSEDTWGAKTIGKSKIKRQTIIFLPLVIGAIFAAYEWQRVADAFQLLMLMGIGAIMIGGMTHINYSTLKDKKRLSQVSVKSWAALVVTLFFCIYMIPHVAGGISADYSSSDKIIVTFDDNFVINTKDSADLKYIGKTKDYFFLYNSKSHTTTCYRMDKVHTFQTYKGNAFAYP